MAEKKFFVDINLQGSALTNAKIGTNSGIGSTEGAFGYDSSAHRLQYFDGTATKEVANLSDIAAVTGGLIFQGGYDPTTDTPDITDGTAYKGFFWAATAAGTFLGESVQVGDSIVAKVDNAGANVADWLILQGNIVIATDSVDGISRLATQTEANDGTEAGAVVITPATLQGKIDAQITPEISNKLPLAGGTMTGNINMNGNEIIMDNGIIEGAMEVWVSSLKGKGGASDDIYLGSNLDANSKSIYNLPAPTNAGDAANKDYVDNNTSNKLPLAGGTMSGNINMNGNDITELNEIDSDNVYTDHLYSKVGGNITILDNLNLNNDASIINLPAPINGGDATNKTYVDDQDALKLSLTGGTMSGNLNMGGNELNIGVGGSLIVATGASEINFGDQRVNGIGTPATNDDAANKGYVDTTAATAESNANDYTDTAISFQSYRTELEAGAWTLVGDTYEATITHNITNTGYPVVTFTDADSRTCEAIYEAISGSAIKVYVNVVPTSLGVSLSAADPRL